MSEANVRDEKQKQSKKTPAERKVELAVERGSHVIIINSGDDLYAIALMLPQLDGALTRMQKGSRRYSGKDVAAFRKEVTALTDQFHDLAARACNFVGFTFRTPAALDEEKNINSQKTIND